MEIWYITLRKSLEIQTSPIFSNVLLTVSRERCILKTLCDRLHACGLCSERFLVPLGAWDGLRYFIVALPEPSI